MKYPPLAAARDDFQPREHWAQQTSSEAHFIFHKGSAEEKVVRVSKDRRLTHDFVCCVVNMLYNSSIIPTQKLFQSESNKLDIFKNED